MSMMSLWRAWSFIAYFSTYFPYIARIWIQVELEHCEYLVNFASQFLVFEQISTNFCRLKFWKGIYFPPSFFLWHYQPPKFPPSDAPLQILPSCLSFHLTLTYV